MATAKTQEARQTSDAYHLALAYLGYTMMVSAWREWVNVDLSRPGATSAAWADATIASVRTARATARNLTRLYYRLFRALHTGETVAPVPGTERRERETLGDLRRDFRLAVEDIIPPQREAPINPHTQRMWKRAGLDEPLPDLPVGGFDDVVELEPSFVWPDDDDEEDEYVESVMDTALDNLIVQIERQRQERGRDKERTAEAEVTYLEDRREKVGTKQAGIAQLSTLGAGRRELYLAGGRDASVLGYIRVSKTGDPCGFCGMLISRGIVLYKSKQTASVRSRDGEEYHPGCNCVVEPVYSRAQYDNDDKFALNRELAQLWKDEVHGKYSGVDALNAFRRILRRRRANARTDEDTTDAQVA